MLKTFKFKIVGLAAVTVTLCSCLKSNNDNAACGYNAKLKAPLTVNEEATLNLSLSNIPTYEINTYYYWHFADMREYTMTIGGEYAATLEDKTAVSVEDFNVWDIGEYRVKIIPGKDGCEPTIVSAYVDMIPKPCPCEGQYQNNSFTFDQSYGGLPTYVTFAPIFYEDTVEHDFGIECFSNPMQYTCDISFNIDLPDYESAYTVLDHHETPVNSFGIDKKRNFSIDLGLGPYPYNYWRVADDQQAYVTMEQGIFLLTFCDLLFIGNYGEELTMSGSVYYN